MTSPRNSDTAKTYQRIQLATGVSSSVVAFLFIVVLVLTGVSDSLATWAAGLTPGRYTSAILFATAFGAILQAVTAPFTYFSEYVIEHRFGLSNQSFVRWLWEHAKGLLISLPVWVGVLLTVVASLDRFGELWWLPVSTTMVILSLFFARIAPVILFPLFYRFTPLEDGTLKERILARTRNAGVTINGIYRFDFSKNTRKANAAFAGIGKSRRILLADTLLEGLAPEEIEAVFTHELGHYVHRHTAKRLVTGATLTVISLFLAARLYEASLPWFGYVAITDLGALPLLPVWLAVLSAVGGPAVNFLSRRHEYQADCYAVRTMGDKEAFVSALRKLGEKNLADPSPKPVVEFLFYSHPSLERRVRFVESK